MDEFTNIKDVDLNALSDEVLRSFGERYFDDASRVLFTGAILAKDQEMIQLAVAIVMALYSKKLNEGVFTPDKMRIH
jgi:hypothetical protein